MKQLYASVKNVYLKLINIFFKPKITDNLKLNTELILAVNEKRFASASRLIKKGANPNVQSSLGSTLLMIAAQSNDVDCCKFLINSGASTSIENHNGETAADIAEKFKNSETLMYLLSTDSLEQSKTIHLIIKNWREILIAMLLCVVIVQANDISANNHHNSRHNPYL